MSDDHACKDGHTVAEVFHRTEKKKEKKNSREKKPISGILHFNIQHVFVLCHFIKKVRNWRHDCVQKERWSKHVSFCFSGEGIVLCWMNLVWIECNMYCLLKTLSRGKARLFLLYFNSSRKVFNLKQIAFREDRSRQPIVNTQCNFHSRFYICSLCNHF